MISYVIGAAALLLLSASVPLGIITYNSLTREWLIVQECYSGLGGYLMRRNELIRSLGALAAGAAGEDHPVVLRLTEWLDESCAAQHMAAQNIATSGINRLLPDLHALLQQEPGLLRSEERLILQARLDQLDQDINHLRRYYNAAVRNYNQQVGVFPKNIVAALFSFRAAVFFSEDQGGKPGAGSWQPVYQRDRIL